MVLVGTADRCWYGGALTVLLDGEQYLELAEGANLTKGNRHICVYEAPQPEWCRGGCPASGVGGGGAGGRREEE